MSLWIELRCDVRAACCYSHQNNGPTDLVSQNRSSLEAGVRRLERDAREAGWKRRSDATWACPNCSKEQA